MSLSVAEPAVRTYKEVAAAGLQRKNADGAYAPQSVSRTKSVTTEDGFTTVSSKRRGAPEVQTSKHRKQPLIGVSNSACLPVISKERS
jgi:hypothetical protein